MGELTNPDSIGTEDDFPFDHEMLGWTEDVYDRDEILRLFEQERFVEAMVKFEGSPALEEVARYFADRWSDAA